MGQHKLGLFDTPPTRREIQFALATVVLIFAALLAVLPARNLRVGALAQFIPTMSAIIFVCDLMIAATFYAQAAVFRSRALTALASGYLLAGFLLVPYSLTFPGSFAPHGLLGAKLNTAAWISTCWRMSVPIAVILYALLKRADAAPSPVAERPPARIVPGILCSTVLAVLITLLATLGHDLLPAFFVNQTEVIRAVLVRVNMVAIILVIAGMALLYRLERSVLDMWLLVALSAWLAQSLLNALLYSRVSLGAYAFFGLSLTANLIIMLALVAESSRLYARLALSTAARDRERDARLMSMDAVAAAISHEVGQPLTAVTLHASASLKWLTRARPDREKAIGSLQDTIDAGRRTFDVIKSVRATFSKGTGSLTELSLNDIARETSAMLDRELTAHRILLQLELDEGLAPVIANRVQIQRVLVNLITNAIESIGSRKRSDRQIWIRTGMPDGQNVSLDISDTGEGISAESMPHIFDPFFTTKSSGTGLGLSLSRSIVEDHGGHLWASSHRRGATFHLQLPEASKAKH